jgi:RNA polymerase sigma-70 factor, ECF subfamily
MHPSTITTSHGINGIEGVVDRDMELVSAARSGSSDAFEELQNLYSRRLYRRIFSMTKNREDAEDALQDTFLRAYVALKSFEGRSQFASW